MPIPKAADAGSTLSQPKTVAQTDGNDAQMQASHTQIPGIERLPSRSERIALAAYYHAERRAFAADGELDDWLAAEREIDAEHESHGKGAEIP